MQRIECSRSFNIVESLNPNAITDSGKRDCNQLVTKVENDVKSFRSAFITSDSIVRCEFGNTIKSLVLSLLGISVKYNPPKICFRSMSEPARSVIFHEDIYNSLIKINKSLIDNR